MMLEGPGGQADVSLDRHGGPASQRPKKKESILGWASSAAGQAGNAIRNSLRRSSARAPQSSKPASRESPGSGSGAGDGGGGRRPTSAAFHCAFNRAKVGGAWSRCDHT